MFFGALPAIVPASPGNDVADEYERKGRTYMLSPLVYPARVRVERQLRVDEFARARPTTLEAAEVAWLNVVDTGGAIPAGLTKSVTGGVKREAQALAVTSPPATMRPGPAFRA